MKIPIRIEGNKVITSCKCDGTYGFAYELQRALKSIGCTDIKVDIEEVIDPDPPWMDTKFVVSGEASEKVIAFIKEHME